MNLKDRVAIVTGTASGIGKGIALRFAAEGAAVAGFDIKIEKAEETAAAIKDSGGTAMALEADVTKYAVITKAVDKVLAEFGHIDILVNCAGAYRQMDFKDQQPKDWEWILELNVNGTLNCTRAVINHMIEREYGRIINISSIAAEVGIKRMADYSASKGAIVSFTKALAIEVGPHSITVNSVAPGAILLGPPKGSAYQGKGIYLPRPGGTPADVAAIVAFLASDDAAYITGANYTVDGGRVLGPRGS